MTAPTPPASAPHVMVPCESDPREAALRERYAPGWRLATDIPSYAKILKPLGVVLFVLFGLAILAGLVESPGWMAGQMVVSIAAPALSLGGILLAAVGLALDALGSTLMAAPDTAFYTAKRDQGP